MLKPKYQRLLDGESFETKEFGNSMSPLIESGQSHWVEPADWQSVEIGGIVYCRVKGRFYTHLVKAKSDRGCLIGSNKGTINGWTKKVFGKVILK